MKLLHRQSLGSMSVLFVLLVLGLMVAGCAPDANAQLVSPQLGEQLAQIEASGAVEVKPTAAPIRFVDLTPEQVTAGLPPEFAAALAAADPSKGEAVSVANGCGGCHALDPANTVITTGPNWALVADHAANRVPGESPALYIYHSITSPGMFVVPNYPNGVMPTYYGERIATEDLANLVAFLLQHHE